jgi:hypothetical protein
MAAKQCSGAPNARFPIPALSQAELRGDLIALLPTALIGGRSCTFGPNSLHFSVGLLARPQAGASWGNKSLVTFSQGRDCSIPSGVATSVRCTSQVELSGRSHPAPATEVAQEISCRKSQPVHLEN